MERSILDEIDNIKSPKTYKQTIPGEDPLSMLGDLVAKERVQRTTGMQDSDSEEETKAKQEAYKKAEK